MIKIIVIGTASIAMEVDASVSWFGIIVITDAFIIEISGCEELCVFSLGNVT